MDSVDAIAPEYKTQIINHDFDDGEEFIEAKSIGTTRVNFLAFRENAKLQPPIL